MVNILKIIPDVVQVLANISIVCTLLFGAYQIYLDKKERELQNRKQERLKAIDLAGLYSKELINNISYLSSVYEKAGIQEKLQKIKPIQLKKFDRAELEELFTLQEIKEIDEAMNNIDLKILMDEAYKHFKNRKEHIVEFITDSAIHFKVKNEEAVSTLDDDTFYKQNMLNDLYYNKIYINTLNDTLNTLEYFCMYFNSGVADEETIYQSLHQSFISMVQVLYFKISFRNYNGKDKYYTNIIDLYEKWINRFYQMKLKEIDANRKCEYKNKKIRDK